MNYVIILAGGVGSRMKVADGTPKQFLEVAGKPILVQTVGRFQESDNVDKIIISCVKDYIPLVKKLVVQYNLDKVIDVVEGGATYQMSCYNGLNRIRELSDDYAKDYVSICDGVRPLVSLETINKSIETAHEKGSGVTATPATVSVYILDDEKKLLYTTDRDKSFCAQAPTTYKLETLLEVYDHAISLGDTENKDTPSMMAKYGYEQFCIVGNSDNIKITNPEDYYILRALLEFKEASQAIGVL